MIRRAASVLAVLAFLSSPAFAGEPVEAALADALMSELGATIPANARVSVTLTMPVDGPVQDIRNLVHDPRTGHIKALATTGNGKAVELRAKADIIVDVPVPTRRMLPGEVIGEGDLATVPMAIERLGDTIVTDRAKLIGLAGRRQLVPGRPIQTGSVGAPIVVERNRPVQLIFEDGELRLSAQGRALQDGGVGDTVRVMNSASNVVVTGTVRGPKTVTVGGATKTAEIIP